MTRPESANFSLKEIHLSTNFSCVFLALKKIILSWNVSKHFAKRIDLKKRILHSPRSTSKRSEELPTIKKRIVSISNSSLKGEVKKRKYKLTEIPKRIWKTKKK